MGAHSLQIESGGTNGVYHGREKKDSGGVRSPLPEGRKKQVYQPYYDAPAADMLEVLWKNFNWPCGKLFAPFLRLNLDPIRVREKYRMSDTVAGKLKKISPRTIDRFLRKPRQRMNIRETSGTKPVRLLHRSIPILTWFEYARMPSGYFQIDPVRHDGGNPSGECGNFVSGVPPSP
ncbi:MAG: hypothetical protein LBO65_07900 [Spirochaetaceae bacterium]|jgi:hypothetical protein|nr:hypothetical protein [Spirochaetaceae bacterium]